MHEKISVVIPAYNSSSTIRNCLLSIIQTGYPSLEIIVVDDDSLDQTADIVNTLSEQYPKLIHLICQNKNCGPAKARNTGAAYATGEYLFFLDSDTEVLPDIFDKFIYRINYADAVTGIYHYHPLNPGFVQWYKALFNYYFFSRNGVVAYEVFDASRAGIKAGAFRQLGGFNESLCWGMDYENEEFGYRLCKNYKNLLDPSIMARHRFPNFKKLTKIYFNRVMFWAELFFFRRKFESAGLTSGLTGISTISMPMALLTLPIGLTNKHLILMPLFFFFIYLLDYSGFFWFILKKKILFLPAAIILNAYFSFVIGAAAVWGILKAFAGYSRIKEEAVGLFEKE